jgi:hypothetical protein
LLELGLVLVLVLVLVLEEVPAQALARCTANKQPATSVTS